MRFEIESADSLTELWIELTSRFESHYTSPASTTITASDFIRRVYLYGMWCSAAEDWRAREVAYIGFFESIAPFAIRSGKSEYSRIVEDLVANLGMPEIKRRAGNLGYSLSSAQLQQLLKDAEEFARIRTKRSAKR